LIAPLDAELETARANQASSASEKMRKSLRRLHADIPCSPDYEAFG
jgi:hypothetical protein